MQFNQICYLFFARCTGYFFKEVVGPHISRVTTTGGVDCGHSTVPAIQNASAQSPRIAACHRVLCRDDPGK